MPSLIHRTGRSVPQAGREVRVSVARWESNSKWRWYYATYWFCYPTNR